jgi:MOSC domain-containing protein YiiM
VGQAVVQVSQPRQPCWKLAYRWRMKDLTARVERTGRTGWYLRVLEEGDVAAGQPLVLLDRPFPEWTVQRASGAMAGRKHDRQAALALAALPPLSASWRETLSAAAEGEAEV